jgi:hypothetical protein
MKVSEWEREREMKTISANPSHACVSELASDRQKLFIDLTSKRLLYRSFLLRRAATEVLIFIRNVLLKHPVRIDKQETGRDRSEEAATRRVWHSIYIPKIGNQVVCHDEEDILARNANVIKSNFDTHQTRREEGRRVV